VKVRGAMGLRQRSAGQLVLQREARVSSCSRVWSVSEVECRMPLAECRYGAAVALAAGFTDWNCAELQARRGGGRESDRDDQRLMMRGEQEVWLRRAVAEVVW
jgi:hypothetical protein